MVGFFFHFRVSDKRRRNVETFEKLRRVNSLNFSETLSSFSVSGASFRRRWDGKDKMRISGSRGQKESNDGGRRKNGRHCSRFRDEAPAGFDEMARRQICADWDGVEGAATRRVPNLGNSSRLSGVGRGFGPIAVGGFSPVRSGGGSKSDLILRQH